METTTNTDALMRGTKYSPSQRPPACYESDPIPLPSSSYLKGSFYLYPPSSRARNYRSGIPLPLLPLSLSSPPCLHPDPSVKELTNPMWSYPANSVYSTPDTIHTISLAKPDNVHRISSNYCGPLPYGRISSSILPRSRKAE